jgi:hypothetical protein
MSRALHRHAQRQLGCFTHEQARGSGITERTIERYVARGLWDELAPFVYRAAPAGRAPWQQRLLALALSVGGVAYGRSAAALYGLLPPPRHPEVLVERADRSRMRPGLHSTRSLPRAEITVVGSVPATMPARTVIDAAAALRQTSVERLVDAAVVRELTTAPALARRAAELHNAKRPGCAKVLHALATQHPNMAAARNEWEAGLVRLAGKRGLPSPVSNLPVVVGGQRRLLDLAWPERMVALEFDGFGPHTVREVFDDDRVRQNALVAAGWTVFRVTSRMLQHDAEPVFRQLATAIGARGHENRQIRRIS